MTGYIPFSIRTFQEFDKNYLQGGLGKLAEYLKIEAEHINKNMDWIDEKLSENGCDWIVFGGTTGEIHLKGDMEHYPDEGDLYRLGNEKGEVPFTYPQENPREDISDDLEKIREELKKVLK